jgi:leucyl aminopeptidase (aminopeptidase T)
VEFLSNKDLQAIARRSLNVRRGERIYLSGNAYGLPLLDPLLRVLRRMGARVTPAIWSDEQLVHDLLRLPPAAVASRWMPRPLPDGLFEALGTGRMRLDKVVVLFASSLERVPSLLANDLGREGKRFFERYQAFQLAAGANQHAAGERGVPYALVEFPSRFVSQWFGLPHETVEDDYRKALAADPREIRRLNRIAAAFFRGRDAVRVTCPRGTDFRFRLGRLAWRGEDTFGRFDHLVQLPGGEAYVPLDGRTGEGTVVSGPPGFEKRVIFRKGKAMTIRALQGRKWVRATHPLVNGREPFCEFGIGTNPSAPPLPTGPIYEKAYGTVHFGVGGNAFFGGPIRRPKHRDFIIENPRVEADGVLFAEGGEWAIPHGKP